MRGLIILLLAAALIEASFLSVIAQECPLDLTWSNFTTISIKCSDQSDHTMCCRYINALITVSVSLYSSQTGTLGVPLSLSETCETLISQTLISHNISAQSLSFCGLGSKIPVSYNCQGMNTVQEISSSPNFIDIINNCKNNDSNNNLGLLSNEGCKRCLNADLSYLRHLIGQNENNNNNNSTMNICRDASFVAVVNNITNLTAADLATCFFTVQGLSLIQDNSSVLGPAIAPSGDLLSGNSPSENLTTVAFNAHHHHSFKLVMITGIGIMVMSLSILLILILFLLIQKKKRELSKMDTSNNNHQNSHEGISSIFRRFSYKEIKRATGNFSTSLGRGENGILYKGQLDDGSKVAIKCIKNNNNNINDNFNNKEEFYREMEFLARLHHKHLISIKGFCFNRNERFLVYEYMEYGSLEDHLHSSDKPPLSWQTRIRIAIDIANALEYLHCYCDPTLCHGDIKSSNILLDSTFRAKVVYFGHAQFSLDLKIHGTAGYIDPEYLTTNQLTSKSDIYSYGILLLELITSKPPLTNNNNSLLDSVHQHQSEISALNAVYSLLDPTVRDTCESSELNTLLEIITLCTKKEGRERPGMKQVVRLLYDRWDPVNYPVNREFDRAVEVEEGQYGNFGGNGRGVLQSSSSTSRSYCSRSRLLEGGNGCESPDSPRGVF
ncbi:hypothetical protein LUZ60_004212 [Juncus effusus]|nr:hypothetical protein LUZ60_004212 [Juncus effusus]